MVKRHEKSLRFIIIIIKKINVGLHALQNCVIEHKAHENVYVINVFDLVVHVANRLHQLLRSQSVNFCS